MAKTVMGAHCEADVNVRERITVKSGPLEQGFCFAGVGKRGEVNFRCSLLPVDV